MTQVKLIRRMGGDVLYRNRGASYLEFVIAVIVVLALIGVALSVLLSVSVNTERARINDVIQGIERSLFALNSEYKVKNRLWQLEAFASTNPVQFLLKPLPEDYVGEIGNRDEKPDPGTWYFNYDRDVLVYRVSNDDALEQASGSDELTFKLRFKYADNNENRHFDAGEEVYGLAIEPTAPYRWLE